jgi:hypothetical protein
MSSGTHCRSNDLADTLAGLLVVFMLASGCATGTASNTPSAADRDPPIEVSDHTIDDGGASLDPSVQPTVDVRMERGRMLGVDRTSYEGRVQRGTIRCYRKRLRRIQKKSEGTMVYEILVTRNGRVAGTEVVSTAIREDQFESCVQRVLSELRFDVPSNRRPVYRLFFRLDFRLETIVPDQPPV